MFFVFFILCEEGANLRALIKTINQEQKKGTKIWVGRNLPSDVSYKDVYKCTKEGLVSEDKK